MELPARFRFYAERMNTYLDQILPAEDAPPQPIHRAMRYSLFAGGKRLRPILSLAACEALGGKPDFILPAAAAIEMVHTYSLIHDDLPCMDDDDFRRGKPTNHKVFGEAIAVLAGDALLTAAFEHVLKSYEPDIARRTLGMLAEAAGTAGMIGGQVIDMTSESKVLSMEELDRLHLMKTGAMIRYAAVVAPVVLKSGADAERTFSQYGGYIGLAFQIVDDVLDVESTAEVLGKTPGKDEKFKKVTYPSLLGIEKSKKLAEDLIRQARVAIQGYDRDHALQDLAHYIWTRKK